MKRNNFLVQLEGGDPVIKHAFNAGVKAGAELLKDHAEQIGLPGWWYQESSELLKHNGNAICGHRVWVKNSVPSRPHVRVTIKLEPAQLPEGALDNPAIKAYYPEIV